VTILATLARSLSNKFASPCIHALGVRAEVNAPCFDLHDADDLRIVEIRPTPAAGSRSWSRALSVDMHQHQRLAFVGKTVTADTLHVRARPVSATSFHLPRDETSPASTPRVALQRKPSRVQLATAGSTTLRPPTPRLGHSRT
jgi:hypothetical protein